MVVAAGAVATVVVAGLNFSGIGSLTRTTPGHRLLIAVAGLIATLVGITWALVATARLAGSSTIGVSDLQRDGSARFAKVRRLVNDDSALHYWLKHPPTDGSPPFDALAAELDATNASYVNDLRLWRDSDEEEPSTASVDRSAIALDRYNDIMSRALEAGSYLKLLQSFRATLVQLGASLLLAGIGLVGVVWAANPPDDQAQPASAITDAILFVPAADRTDVMQRLGETACTASLDELPVLILQPSEDDASATVVVNAPGCAHVRLDVSFDDLTAP